MERIKTGFIKAAGMSALLMLAAFSAVSCSLEEDTTTFTSRKTFYRTYAQCVAGLNSCYIPLKSIYVYQYMIATEGVTDICFIASGTQDAQLDISPAKPRFGAVMWTQCYKGIMYCNAVIAGIENSPLDEDDKTALIAEGMIMRAFYYYQLTCFFGDVPFYTEDVDNEETQARVARLPRMSADDTRGHLMAELEQILPELPQSRSSDVADNRVGASVGWMLVAKMAMWNGEYEQALEAIGKLESIYGSLDQYPLSDIPFRRKNTPESIFEIQHLYTAGGVNYTSNIACICMPYPRDEGKAVYGASSAKPGVEIKELGNECTAWSPMRPNTYFYNELQPAAVSDARRDMHIITSWEGNPFPAARPWFGPKFWSPGQYGQYDANNHKVFRYADALLMAAECHYHLEDSDKSIEYLNMVRTRAGLADYTFRSWERLFDVIQGERARELFGEFHRKYDLVRWGTWYKRTLDYSEYAKVTENILPCHEYYPIPDTQVAYSGGALDNKAYEAYGL